MRLFTEVVYKSLTKSGEELCGDSVEVVRSGDRVIVVLADGLGSGVKANILSTLTTRIASTMIKNEASIEEVVKTLINTLPVCKVRNLAYSTFSILKVEEDGQACLFEFDNPNVIYLKDGKTEELARRVLKVEDKKIMESRFIMNPGDKLFMISDGVVHAGIGGILNLGWQWSNVAQYMEKLSRKECYIFEMVNQLIKVCNHMYAGKPGDDTTVAGIQVTRPRHLTLLIGPPQDRSRDKEVVYKLMNSEGKKAVCGGTTANIVSRETGKEIITNLDYFDPDVPPIGDIEGLDLVTEGLLTLNRCVKVLKGSGMRNGVDNFYNRKDGASRLLDLLVNYSTNIRFMIGRALNPVHQGYGSTPGNSAKFEVIDELIRLLSRMGKEICIEYY
jgi:hypothetical protein